MDTGSEHRIDGQQAELEIHFVHYKRGAINTQGDYTAVVSVLADVAEKPISGIWSKLNLSAIQSNFSTPISTSGVVLMNFSPSIVAGITIIWGR